MGQMNETHHVRIRPERVAAIRLLARLTGRTLPAEVDLAIANHIQRNRVALKAGAKLPKALR